MGRRERLKVFGGDYDTPDGTCVRDFTHVSDVVDGHVAALRYVFANEERLRGAGAQPFNMGKGKGHSVLEVIRTFEQVRGHPTGIF